MAFISVKLVDGRDINLDVSGCETFADVKAIIRNQFGVLYAFEFSKLPVTNVVGDSEKVKSVMKSCCNFNTHLCYFTHVNVKVNIRIITGEQPVVKDIDLFRVESVNHLRRELREAMGWDEDFHFLLVEWTHLGSLGEGCNTPWWCNEVAVAIVLWQPYTGSETSDTTA